jgi:hypothetical protein
MEALVQREVREWEALAPLVPLAVRSWEQMEALEALVPLEALVVRAWG